MLGEQLEGEPGADHGVDHVRERVLPLDRGVVAGRQLQVRVAALHVVVEVLALRIVEIVHLDLELVLREDPGEGMELGEIEEAAGLEEVGDAPGPAR